MVTGMPHPSRLDIRTVMTDYWMYSLTPIHLERPFAYKTHDVSFTRFVDLHLLSFFGDLV